MSSTASIAKPLRALWPYFQIARLNHWGKNAFMLLGVVLAFFYRPKLFTLDLLPSLGLAFLCTCLVASANYVINEYLDASLDRFHPKKKNRPAVNGQIRGSLAFLEWLALGGLGVGLGFMVNPSFGLMATLFWTMGCIYNVRPFRAKEHAYIDVLTESLNNPIRLMLGWHALIEHAVAPLSLLLSYWMLGAFFMATKRFAEYRQLGDKKVAAAYRSSFKHYDDNRLLVSMVFYVAACALFAGIFIVRYKLELILSVPLGAGFIAYYVKLSLKPDSPVQAPERLHRERGFVVYAFVTLALFVLLMFVDIPVLYQLFNVDPSHFEPLWRIG